VEKPAVLHETTGTHHAIFDTDTPRQYMGHVDALNLTVSLCLCYTLYIALTRLRIRRGAFRVDDLVVLAATLVTHGHTGSRYAALALESGKLWSEVNSSSKLTESNKVGHNHRTTI
jgi:hypothetical protein